MFTSVFLAIVCAVIALYFIYRYWPLIIAGLVYLFFGAGYILGIIFIVCIFIGLFELLAQVSH